MLVTDDGLRSADARRSRARRRLEPRRSPSTSTTRRCRRRRVALPSLAVPRDAAAASPPAMYRAAACREALADGARDLQERFRTTSPSRRWCATARRMVDAVLRAAWTLHRGPADRDVALVAVGGYGRGELHPCSDVDILILCPTAERRRTARASSTSSPSCGTSASKSATACAPSTSARERRATSAWMTTLMEARLLAGPRARQADAAAARARSHLARRRRSSRRSWRSSGAATEATRHRLQPRAQRQGRPRRTARPADDRLGREAALRRQRPRTTWSSHGFLTPARAAQAAAGAGFLWSVRFGLHVSPAAARTACCSTTRSGSRRCSATRTRRYTLAVEQLMQRYYRTVMDVSC